MRQLGLLLLVLGIGSCVVQLMDMEMRLLAWINQWGEPVAWAIRGGCIALGLLFLKMGGKKGEQKK
jgi:hypothetical protein